MNLLKSWTVISCSQISSKASFSCIRLQPPCGSLFLSFCFKILYRFSIGFKSGEEGGQSNRVLIKHSSLIALQRPWFPLVSFRPCILLPSSTQKKSCRSLKISFNGPCRICSAYFLCVKPFPWPSVLTKYSSLLKLYPIAAQHIIESRPELNVNCIQSRRLLSPRFRSTFTRRRRFVRAIVSSVYMPFRQYVGRRSQFLSANTSRWRRCRRVR